jgi:serine/threonine protein phosphatase PrpC
MQGWRNQQEDSHVCELDIADGVSILGVFDGHGGTHYILSISFIFS